MKIIYHCFGGAHSSVTAAGIHLGLLPTDRKPTKEELLRIPYFDQQTGEDHGILRLMGDDELGNQVYIIGRRSLKNNFPALINNLLKILGLSTTETMTVDTMTCVNWLMVLGGYTSRKLRLVAVGRPVVIWGVQRAYQDFISLVKHSKSAVQRNGSK